MSPKLRNLLFFLMLVFYQAIGYSQKGLNPPPPAAPGPPPPPVGLLPIDDYLWVLVVAGILLGAWYVNTTKAPITDS